MPRKKLTYTDAYPYHIVARCNNKEWFHLNLKSVWEIFISVLNQTYTRFNFQVHSFVLMNNHYHMIASAKINKKTRRINHVFGSRYKASLITSSHHFSTVMKYVYQNPVQANICQHPSQYLYSSLNNSECITTCLISGIYSDLPSTKRETYSWLKQEESLETYVSIKKGLQKTLFKPIYNKR